MSPRAEAVRANRDQRRSMTFARASTYGMLLLAAISWGYILMGVDSGVPDLASGKTWSNAGNFSRQLIGIDSPTRPAYLEVDRWLATGRLALDTLAMSVLAIGMAALAALATFMFGARNIMMGELAPHGTWAWRAVFYAVRGVFTFTRAIPELVWAMLIIFVIAPGILPGAVALAIHNWGILGKRSAEVVEGLDPRPIRALQ
ncbi:MAG: ABC transporter permease, partial [Chloroflexi bacterium]|nr:ABC transporter permease [Chloroflexota bacterium]